MGGHRTLHRTKKPPPKTAKIIPRAEWGAQPIKGPVVKLKHPVMYVRYGYTGTDECRAIYKCSPVLQAYQQKFIDEKFADQPFNFLIGSDGLVYEGRGWDLEADRPDKINRKIKGNAVDIGFIGDFSDEKPSDTMIEYGELLVKLGLEERYIRPLPKILNLNDYQPLLEDD